MKTKKLYFFNIFILIFIGFFSQSFALVFGQDDRKEIHEVPALNQLISPSVAIMLSPIYLKKDPLGFLMDFPTISDSSEIALCPEQKFSHQPIAGVSCTGFLVAPDLMITAGHCMTHEGTTLTNEMSPYCSDFKWVFDFKYDQNGQLDSLFKTENVFSCKEVIYAKFNYRDLNSKNKKFGEDIALIRIESKQSRPFLSLNPKFKVNEKVSMVGHPEGLPQKATMNGFIKQTNSEHYFNTNLDAFSGNSGSPILDKNLEAIGVLVRAFPAEDYKYLKARECSVVNHCDNNGRNCLLNDKEKLDDEIYAQGQKLTSEILELVIKNNQLNH